MWEDYLQVRAWLHAYFGEDDPASEMFRRLNANAPVVCPALEDGTVVDVNAFVADVATTRTVIFVNEAHHVPRHRATTIELLGRLHELGFRYFAAELLTAAHRAPGGRFPRLTGLGYYHDEALAGEMLRTAMRLGYRMVAYDDDTGCRIADEACHVDRERRQAANLYQSTLAGDPDAKILVHAGFGHIAKRSQGTWVPMALHFEHLSGVVPYSIDQTMFDGCRRTGPREPSFDIGGEPRVPFAGCVRPSRGLGASPYDAYVVHRSAEYCDGRPTWRVGPNRGLVEVPRSSRWTGQDCVAEVVRADEGPRAVPVDRIRLRPDREHPPVIVPRDVPLDLRVIAPTGQILLQHRVAVVADTRSSGCTRSLGPTQP